MDIISDFFTCPKCGIDKPITGFYKNKSYKIGYAMSACKSCQVAKSVEKAKNNPKVQAYKRAWHQKNKERLREKSKAYRELNKEQLSKKKSEYNSLNRDKSKIRMQRWKENNPTGVNDISRRRRARKLNNGIGKYTESQVLDKYGTNCHICNLPIDFNAPRLVGKPGWENGLHIDHIVSICNGGPDTLDNVKPAHGLCNLRKPRR